MVMGLAGVIDGVGGWCESCSCHGRDAPLLLPPPPRKQRRMAFAFAQAGTERRRTGAPCPMKGKRLPELVAGGLSGILGNVSESIFVALMTQHRPFLTADEWNAIVTAFEFGKAKIALELQIKLDFVRRLPWRLAVLAHNDVALARREMSTTVAEFDAQDPGLRQHHHRVTLSLLSPQCAARRELEMFIGGSPLSDLPQLEFWAACFRFVPIVERYLEAAHSIVKRKVAPRASGTCVSLSRIMLRLELDLAADPSMLSSLADAFDQTRDLRKIPDLLGIGQHPDLLSRRGTKNKWALLKVLGQIVYRMDVQGQFPEVQDAAKHHVKSQRAAVRAGAISLARVLPPPLGRQPSLRDSVYATALVDHFRHIASSSPSAVFSFLPVEGAQRPRFSSLCGSLGGASAGGSLQLEDDVDPGRVACLSSLSPVV